MLRTLTGEGEQGCKHPPTAAIRTFELCDLSSQVSI